MRPSTGVDVMRISLLLIGMFVAHMAAADSSEPLSIKGATIGDSREKGSRVGFCDVFRFGHCVGKTSYGPATNADFSVTYIDGRVSDIMISFGPRYSAEVLSALTRKYGQSTATGCKAGVTGCHEWKKEGLSLLLIEDMGAVNLRRATTEGNY